MNAHMKKNTEIISNDREPEISSLFSSDKKINKDDFYIKPLLEVRNDEPDEGLTYMKLIEVGEHLRVIGLIDMGESSVDTTYKKIPLPLQLLDCWIFLDYKEGFQTEPHQTRGEKSEQALSKKNWMPYKIHHFGYSELGMGLVLCDETMVNNKRVIAISVDRQSDLSRRDINSLWKLFNRTYREITPSGFVFIGIVNSPAQNISYNGFKVSYSDTYVELTGYGHGQLAVIDLSCISTGPFFKGTQKHEPRKIPINKTPRTERNVARVKKALTFVDANCSYDIYMRVVWSILATGWDDSEQLARDWSLTALHRFEEHCFDNLVRGFDPTREESVGVGTLFALAKEGGFHG